jgi:hypothetical protein
MIACQRSLYTIIAAMSCLLSASCAMLRTQTIRGSRTVWLSRTADDTSLNKLILLNKGKLTDTDPQLVTVERGVEVYITEFTTKRCQGRDVFVRVQIKNGDIKGLEGWLCGASTTNHKVVGL